MNKQRVLILGSGFGGVSTAQELARLLPDPENSDTTLVDRNNFLIFTPMLTDLAAGEVHSEDVVVPVRRLSRRLKFVQGDVIHSDPQQKRVTVEVGKEAPGVPPATRTLEADHLVIALGSETNFHGIKGAEKYSPTINSVEDAAGIRNRALALMERADVEDDQSKRRELLTIVVVGGGFSGVETMAAVNDLVRESVRLILTSDRKRFERFSFSRPTGCFPSFRRVLQGMRKPSLSAEACRSSSKPRSRKWLIRG